jgi:hypothetical protein
MVVADKGYDSEKLRGFVRDNDATPVIHRKGNSLVGNDDIDWCMYNYRHLVENAFGRIIIASVTKQSGLKSPNNQKSASLGFECTTLHAKRGEPNVKAALQVA